MFSKNTMKKVYSPLFLSASVTLLVLTGCTSTKSQSNQALHTVQSQSTTTTVTTNPTDSMVTSKGMVSGFNTALDNLFSDKITPAQASCLQQADNEFAINHIQGVFLEKLTPEELQQMDQFFSSPLGEKIFSVVHQGIQEAVQPNIDSKLDSVTFTQHEEQEFLKISNTQAYQKFSMILEDPNSSIQSFQPIFLRKVQSCQINPNVIED